MIINGIQNRFFPAQTVANLQSQLAQLQTELGTGLVSQDYAGIPNDRGLAMTSSFSNMIATTVMDGINKPAIAKPWPRGRMS